MKISKEVWEKYDVPVVVLILGLILYFIFPVFFPKPEKIVSIQEIEKPVIKKDSVLIANYKRLDTQYKKLLSERNQLLVQIDTMKLKSLIKKIVDTSHRKPPVVVYKQNLGIFLDSTAIKDYAKLSIDSELKSKQLSIKDSMLINQTSSTILWKNAFYDLKADYQFYQDSTNLSNKKQKRKSIFKTILTGIAGIAVGRATK